MSSAARLLYGVRVNYPGKPVRLTDYRRMTENSMLNRRKTNKQTNKQTYIQSTIFSLFQVFQATIFAYLFLYINFTRNVFTVPDNNEHVVQLNSFKVTPEVVSFPGNFSVWVNLTFNRELVFPYVDFELTRYLFGFPLKLPCRDGTVVGTW